MPFTIAHSVAAKPLHRLSGGRLLLPGLAVGAMAPDFEYLVHLSATRTIGHTIPGLFVLCLPSALLVLYLWHRLVGPVLATLLRPGTGGLTNGWPALGGSRRRCRGDTPQPPGRVRFGPPAHFARLCASIVIGSFSHITWDAFTHQGGVVVNLWSGFSHPIGPGALPVYRWLQYGCSVFGTALLGVWAHRASQRPAPPGDVAEGDGRERVRDGVVVLSRTRRAVAAAMVGGLLLMGAVGSVQGASQGDTLDVLKGGIIGALAGALLSSTLSCAALTRRPASGKLARATCCAGSALTAVNVVWPQEVAISTRWYGDGPRDGPADGGVNPPNCPQRRGRARYRARPMGIQADYVRKIQGLLATAESLADQGNEEAAGAYVAKAHALQQKYSIDQAMLAGGEAPRAIIDRTWVMPGAYGRRKVNLAHVVAVHTGCAGYFARAEGGGYRFCVFGFTADVEWAETLFFSLCHQAQAALGFAVRGPYDHGRSFTTAFLEGFTQEVARRLREAAREAKAAAAQEHDRAARGSRNGRSVALVLADKAKRVEAELAAKVGRLSTSRLSGSQSSSGYQQGRAAGRDASLTRGSVSQGAAPSLPR